MSKIINFIKTHSPEQWQINITLVMANLAIAFGIAGMVGDYIFALNMESDRAERELMLDKRKYAVEAIARIYNSTFYVSTATINTKENIKESREFIDASNYVFNSYYNLSVIYNNNIADNKIIGESIKFILNKFINSELFKKGIKNPNNGKFYGWNPDAKKSIMRMYIKNNFKK